MKKELLLKVALPEVFGNNRKDIMRYDTKTGFQVEPAGGKYL